MTKRFYSFLTVALLATIAWAQGVKPLPSLHVEGRWLVDQHGNHVVLHGVMDTPSAWFNGGRWGWSYDDDGRKRCLEYFEKLFTGFEEAKCNIFRLHLDPAWTNDPSDSYRWSGAAEQDDSKVGGESDIKKFNPTRLKTYLTSLYWPLMQKAMNHGQYVVVRPPGVCPQNLKVGDYYQNYLLTVWDIVTQNNNIKKYAGQIAIELANEPVNLKDANGQDTPAALHDYFQPIVDKIRANGFTGIIWVPGTGYQSNYRSYATNPIEGYNIGYAVHDYCGWYGSSDDHCDPQAKIRSFGEAVPVVNTNPIFISEVDWSPQKEPKEFDKLNEHGDSVFKNMGTWATGSTSKWGKAYKANIDYWGNISMTLTHPHDFLEIDTLIQKGKVIPAFGGHPEACAQACMEWYADYYTRDWAHADFTNNYVSDQGNGYYKNPIIYADFPDPDVIRVGDTFYMVTTTMHHFPGCTIVKSKDLVNWEYCAQPLEQLSESNRYSLISDANAYAAGMWACSMKYHNGVFYILINGNDAGGYVLTATDPEGQWEKKKLPRIYYDPGMLFDNGKVYVACGIGNIQMCELDENFNFIREERVISDKDGLEGCHLYKIGDYYYIYATYGGWPSGQAAFRSKNIFGPYEEKMLVEKVIDGSPNTIHQGALFDTPTGEWWTIMQQDLGSFGRMPNLQPVQWVDDWPVVGNNGKPYTTLHKKPDVGMSYPRQALPTNDNFRSYPLGMQWEWNHNPNNSSWSVFERQGWLRLRSCCNTDRLTQARNMLTQRIFAVHGKEKNESTGTIRLDVSHLEEGDRAGICVFQDPYAAIAVQIKDGKQQLVWWQDTLRVQNNFTPTEQTLDIQVDSVIYLRATHTKETNRTQFYYSLDNETFTKFGGQTELGYSLTVFVGARFGLFCYSKPGAEANGYADFDWFSTEPSFDEANYYPTTFEAFSADMLTVEKLEVESEEVDVMIGNSKPLKIMATFRDGHSEDVGARVSYKVSGNNILSFSGGQIRGLKEGKVAVTATYTDPMGNELSVDLVIRSSYFPFSSQYINTSLYSNGTYDEKTHTFKPGQYGQMGWEYPNCVDFSGFKYLVIKLKKTQTCDAHLNVFTANSIWSDCCSQPKSGSFGASKRIILKLQEAKYTSGNKKGEPLDISNIHIISFWGNGNGNIVVDDMYLTNNDDYSPETLDAIDVLTSDNSNEPVNVYTLSGVLVRRNVEGSKAVNNLPAGIYIVGNKKVVIK